MQFKITKFLDGGRFFVKLELTEWTEIDKARAKKFGFPSVKVTRSNGIPMDVEVNNLSGAHPFGFYTKEEAEKYFDFIKSQIFVIKNSWNTLDDTWSNEEII